jgi:hypothetical protein
LAVGAISAGERFEFWGFTLTHGVPGNISTDKLKKSLGRQSQRNASQRSTPPSDHSSLRQANK